MYAANKNNNTLPAFGKLLLIAFLLIASVNTGSAQTRHFRKYSVDEGLPFVQVFTIFQDNKGYLWTGGYGGLSRFNGISFTNYSPKNGLPSHWVAAVAEDAEHNLWVGTLDGLARLNDDQFKTFTTEDGLSSNNIRCLMLDEWNTLWIGTDKGLNRFNGKAFSKVDYPGLKNTSVNCIYQDYHKKEIWVGTSTGLWKIEGNNFKQYVPAFFMSSSITAINRDKNGTMLCGTEDGILRFENGRFTALMTPDNIPMPAVTSMITDKNGVTWIGADNGFFSWNGESFELISIASDSNSGRIISLFIDYEENLWLGTNGGLYRYRGTGFVSYGQNEGMKGSFIFGIAEDNNGNKWFCSENNGIYKYDGNVFQNYNKLKGLPSDKTSACLKMDDGSMMVGTDRGIAIIGNKGINVINKKNGLHSDTINILLRDSKNRIIAGGAGGISIIENNTIKAYYINIPRNVKYDVWSLKEDTDGTIWIGTYLGGLFTFDGKTFKDKGAEIGIRTETYLALEKDKNNIWYFGTLDGIFTWNGKTKDRISEADGLNSDLVYSMILDQKGEYLWVGTNQGLSRIDVNAYDLKKEKNIVTFGKEDGFSGVECNSNGAFLDAGGIIWFGTVNGVVAFNPLEYKKNVAYTRNNITGIRLFYKDTLLSNNAELNYSDNNLSFDFVGICLTNPYKVKYRVKLEGFDPEFSPVTTERTARYSNLPSGTYTLKIISCNNEGLWTPEPVTFTFTIATPFWKKTWFWLLLSAGAVAVLGVGVFLRIRQIKRKERIETETQVALAKNELKALRAQMNPHFVFNSLNSIQHFILTNKSTDATKYLNKFAKLMRIILNNSEKSLITISEELEYLQLYLELESMRFENKFTWHIDIDENLDTEYFEIPAMLLQPYVENAILHGLTPKDSGGKLEIIMKLKGNNIQFSIVDNGIGREKARTMRQLSKKKDHKSLGMKITQDRLELINKMHGSNLSLTITDLYTENNEPAGTRVDIFVPVS
ncbi:MAG: hypothetical protein Fur0041_22190 [Bacteroidia bacterium]